MVFLLWAFFKVLGVFFDVAAFLIFLPFILIGVGLFSLLAVFFAVPLGLMAGVAGLVLAPFALLAPFLPFLLIGAGIYLLVKNQRRAAPPVARRRNPAD